MSKYTTGEVARLCGVTVRTVQYYDARGLLIPSELTEGGRRLYSEDDLRLMRVICYLRDVGLPINTIGQLLAEDDPGSVVSILLTRQENDLRAEILEREEQLEKLDALRREIKDIEGFSVESIGDIAITMTNKDKRSKTLRKIMLPGIPVGLLEAAAIVLWATLGWWWTILIWAAAAIPFGVWASRLYYRETAYICPKCHAVFKPTLKQVIFAAHTPKTRKLTCTECGHKGFCVEVWGDNRK